MATDRASETTPTRPFDRYVQQPRDERWWRCYHAAFRRIHNRDSDGHEYDTQIGRVLDAVMQELAHAG